MYGLYHVLQRTRPGTTSYRQTAALFDSLAGFMIAGFFLSRTYFIILPIFLGLAVARYKATRNEMEALEDEQNWREQNAGAAHTPLLENESDDTEAQGDLVPRPEPLPDISWMALPTWIPRLACLSVISIVGIYVIVKLKL